MNTLEELQLQQPARLENNNDILEKFLVDSPMSIASMLEDATKRGIQFSAFFNGGKDFILTSILEIDRPAARIIFERSADESANKRFLSAHECTFVGFMERVKMQFKTFGMSKTVSSAGYQAFDCSMPSEFYYIQRRDFYRVHVPMRCGAKLSFKNPSSCLTVSAQVFDLSIGGVSVILQTENDATEIGAEIKEAFLHVGGLGEDDISVRVDLETRNLIRTERNGRLGIRMGLSFVNNRMVALERKIAKVVSRIDRDNRSMTSNV